MKRIAPLLLPALFAGGAFAQTYNITPFVTCMTRDPVAGTITTYIGYESFEQAIIQVQVGSDNRFIPNPANRNQPVLFFPGYYEKAFRVTTPGDQIIEWNFLGNAVIISAQLPLCTPASVTAPTLFLPPGTVSAPYSQRLFAVGGQSNLTWSALSTPPPGLGLSSAGVLSGTPQTAGIFTLTVRASDGFTTSQQTYNLLIGNGVTINDAASTRAPGFTPQFRVVTNAASTISATAACDSTEFVITGGGTCTVPNSNTVQGRVASSAPSTNGWTVTCSGGAATAVAVCNKQ